MEGSTNIIVTEPVYENTDDGRTVLAAAVGDELTPSQAERLKVGANGKSTNGVGPATELRREPTGEQPGEFNTQDTPPPAQAVSMPRGFEGMNARDASTSVGNMTAAQLDAALAIENGRTGDKAPRSTVLQAIDARRAALEA